MDDADIYRTAMTLLGQHGGGAEIAAILRAEPAGHLADRDRDRVRGAIQVIQATGAGWPH